MQPQNRNQINIKEQGLKEGAEHLCQSTCSDNGFSKLISSLARHLPVRHISKKLADGSEAPYLQRFYILRTNYLGLYLHRFLDRDQDVEMHDYPWHAFSLVLSGGLVMRQLGKGLSVIERKVRFFNRIEPGHFRLVCAVRPGTWTLLVRFKRVKHWGFIGPVVNGQADYRMVSEGMDTRYQPAAGEHVI